MRWRFGQRLLGWHDDLAPVRLMGVLNVTPDSFSDGGRFADAEAAVLHALAMVAAGAEIVDVGGESSRPGAEPVPAEVEIGRVVPVVAALRARCDAIISIDTTKAAVADAALAAGAEIINDITGLTGDPAMAPLAAARGAGVVLMHMRGRPATMQVGDLSSPDVVAAVSDWLARRIDEAMGAGIDREAICIDPGVGFGKTVEQNVALVARLPELAALGRPVLLGVSRKSFLGALTGRPVGERGPATAAAHAVSVLRGAHVLRVHDVAAARDVVTVATALRGGSL